MNPYTVRGLSSTRWPSLLTSRPAISTSFTGLSTLPSHHTLTPAPRNGLRPSSDIHPYRPLPPPLLPTTRSFHSDKKPRAPHSERAPPSNSFYKIGLPLDRRKPLRLVPPTGAELLHTRVVVRRNIEHGRNKSSVVGEQAAPRQADGDTKTGREAKTPKASGAAASAKSTTIGKSLTDRLPNISYIHRPTREEVLAAATGFWSRMKARFKWFSIRSGRPFNSDEIFALVSWFFLGHMLWIILGTTTFVSLAILAVNTVFAQETLAGWIGNSLTKSSGVKVVFESAIVPKWKDGVISFKNVFVSKRPGQGTGRVSKGSPETAAAAAAAMAEVEPSTAATDPKSEEDNNYTQYDLTLDTVNVTLSFAKWFNGKGLLRDVEIKGIRGVIDRTHVRSTGQDVDPKSFRHEHRTGDFEIDSFKMEDLLVTIHQPRGFRPFPVSIFSCDLPQLRMQWIFYDFLSANTVSGSFDDSLFTIHPRQMHSRVSPTFQPGESSEDLWKKHSRLRIDGLNIDHLNRGVEGPFSWIQEGNVDIVADVLFPAETDDSIAKVMTDFYDQLETVVTSKLRLPRNDHITGQEDVHSDGDPANPNEASHVALTPAKESKEDRRLMVMDLRVNLNDVRAAIPIFTRDLSYVNNALIRPIVAYINSRNTFIPINCRVVKRLSDFDGSWTIFDSGLMDDLSAEVCRFDGSRNPNDPKTDSVIDVYRNSKGRFGRADEVPAFQKGGILVSAASYPGLVHGYGRQPCITRFRVVTGVHFRVLRQASSLSR